MAVSNWWLYIGMFLCCTGFGLIPGAIFIVYWAIMRLENVKLGNSYTENNYDINIQDFHGGNGGSGGSGGSVSGHGKTQSPKPKAKNYLKAISSKTVPINHISDSNLEEMK
jgi:hypothetical protein